MGRKESINERDPEVKRYMNSLCNVQKTKKQKTKQKKKQNKKEKNKKNRASETKNDVLGVFL